MLIILHVIKFNPLTFKINKSFKNFIKNYLLKTIYIYIYINPNLATKMKIFHPMIMP